MVETNEGIILKSYQEAYRAVRTGQEKLGFRVNLAAYLLVNTLLIAINLFVAQEFPWVVFPIVFWGIGVTMHYMFGVRRLEWYLKAEEARVESIARD
jgi:hypothetical protein